MGAARSLRAARRLRRGGRVPHPDAARFVTGQTIPVDGGTLAASGWYRRADGKGWTNLPDRPYSVVLLRPDGARPPIELMKTEVIYNQLAQEFADAGMAPYDQIALDHCHRRLSARSGDRHRVDR